MNNQRIVIVTGGNLGSWALEQIQGSDFVLGVDRGAWFLIEHGIKPHYVLGDFDSVTAEQMAQIRQICQRLDACDPIDKDYTDTELAFNWALNQKPSEIVLLGATGTRLDHTLANLHLLQKALQVGIRCRIIDAHNELQLIQERTTVIEDGVYTYISLLPFTNMVTGITLQGFQYPLQQATLTIGESLGISNRLQSSTGLISLESGVLLVVRSRD